jgi:hypothetical protein
LTFILIGLNIWIINKVMEKRRYSSLSYRTFKYSSSGSMKDGGSSRRF